MARILIAEDDDLFRTVLGDFLENNGHEVTTVSDGDKAWALLEQGRMFDAIIADNNMPNMEGTELLCRVRESPNHSRLPFALMSGKESLSNGKMLVSICAELGARFFLKSRFRPDDLLQGIH